MCYFISSRNYAVKSLAVNLLVFFILIGSSAQIALAEGDAVHSEKDLGIPIQAPLAMTDPPASYSFPAFDTGTLTDGGLGHSEPLNVSGVPAEEYLFFTVSADFKLGTPDSAWSESITLEINNGSSTIYYAPSLADVGKQSDYIESTLKWSGVFLAPYTGGSDLTLILKDSSSYGGLYTSSLENVSLTIYPVPDPVASFTPFDTGTITSETAGVTVALDTGSLPAADYLYYTVSADWVPYSNPPESSWSYYSLMSITDGGSTIFAPEALADSGSRQDALATTLKWSGVLAQSYTGGGSLSITFSDSVSGGPYYSSFENVTINFYAPTTPNANLPTFNTDPIITETTGVTVTLNTTSLPAVDYLFFTVKADWMPGTSYGMSGWSYYSQMRITDGGANEYYPVTSPLIGDRQDADPTTLYWMGVFASPYNGSGSLSITFTDWVSGGPYYSLLENVEVTIYPVLTADLIRVASDCTAVTPFCTTSLAQAVNDIAAGGTIQVVDTLGANDVVIDKDLVLMSNSGGVITGSGGEAVLRVTAGEVNIENLSINIGSSGSPVLVSDGVVTLRGNTIDGDGAAGIIQISGTVTAYANNIVDTGGVGVAGTISAPKNWWGTYVEANRPSGVSMGDWAVRLGADVVSAAFGSGGSVSLESAQLTGPGPGTGVIVNFGAGSANAPFGVGTAPYDAETCSPYYDFYSTGGAGWTVVLPIDTGTAGCTTNALTAEKAYMINDITECASSTDTACWDAIPDGQISINGNNLEISGLTLAGTHIVAGESSGGDDPTALGLVDIRVHSRNRLIPVVAGLVYVFALLGLSFKFR